MRFRLFWKILFGFWFTFICISEGVWLIFAFYNVPHHKIVIAQMMRDIATNQIASAGMVLHSGGESGLRRLLAEWSTKERDRLSVERISDDAVAFKPGAGQRGGLSDLTSAVSPTDPERYVYSRVVVAPDGAAYRLSYDTAKLPKRRKPRSFGFPSEVMILGVLGGLLFSALLAWNLSTPIWRLRAGFDQLAHGDLGVRLKALMGRRRDEIADLARDFDAMAERLQSLVESREQLLYDVSHELRSPLARQHMAIGLARQNPQRTIALLDRIEQESSRMDELVGELLTLSRIESEEKELDEYFDLQSLVRVVVNNTRFEASGDGVEINLNMPPEDKLSGISTVMGDSELVRRALENVLRNATRHSPRGSRVDVKVTVSGDNRCTVQVSDSGPGVPEKYLKQIFDPFVRLGAAKKQGGVGLGLAIAQRAIAVHGGSIQAVNRQEGGLRISIVLPIEPAE